ncbi:MAG TPA: spore coat protein U domain-containing protein [Usitatibacter sp.]|jgi:spore coat protein U-like protein|nr:spore coat protein U domain-containing protein [Usitatibacter sp.]
MKTILRAWLLACALLAPGLASAAYSCTISSGGFSSIYVASSPTTTIVQTSFTITCTRALADATTMSYSVSADNGANSQGTHNRATFGASRISYDLFKDSACGTQWRGPQTISGTLNFSGSTSASATVQYWGCITASQTGLPAGTYTDSVSMTLTYGNLNSTATTSAGVSITTNPVCNLTTPPSDIVFSYVAFGPVANASTSFGVTCTSTLPYTMALDATSGTVLGVNYTLALSAASGSGSGTLQTYSINGSIAAGQPGTCATGSCAASQPRTLTITY